MFFTIAFVRLLVRSSFILCCVHSFGFYYFLVEIFLLKFVVHFYFIFYVRGQFDCPDILVDKTTTRKSIMILIN